jgi:hypothetical protein
MRRSFINYGTKSLLSFNVYRKCLPWKREICFSVFQVFRYSNLFAKWLTTFEVSLGCHATRDERGSIFEFRNRKWNSNNNLNVTQAHHNIPALIGKVTYVGFVTTISSVRGSWENIAITFRLMHSLKSPNRNFEDLHHRMVLQTNCFSAEMKVLKKRNCKQEIVFGIWGRSENICFQLNIFVGNFRRLVHGRELLLRN